MDHNSNSDTRSASSSFEETMIIPDASQFSASMQHPSTVYVDKPKRALTAYNIYFQYTRQEMLKLQKTTGKRIGFAEMARTVAAMWKQVDENEKQYFASLAQQDKERHAKESVAWKKAKKAAENAIGGTGSIARSGDERTNIRSTATSHKKSNHILEFRVQNGNTVCNTVSMPPPPSQYNEMKQQVGSIAPFCNMPAARNDTGLTAALRRKKCLQSPSQSSPESLARQTTATSGLVYHLMQEKSLDQHFDTASVFPQNSIMSSAPSCTKFSATHAISTFGRHAYPSTQYSQLLGNHTEIEDFQFQPSTLPRDTASVTNGWSDDALFSAEELSQISQPSAVPSIRVMDELADRMGPDCADMFLDMFRS